MNDIIVSVATIPPRVRNGCLSKFIHSMLNQTLQPKKIYVNVSRNYQRFENLTELEINEIKNINLDVIEVIRCDLDSPLIKHIGYLNHHADKSDFVFVGDDDQEYNLTLLERMRGGIYNKDNIYQNRFHVVKTGTAGIIHGFVGLMYQVARLNNFHSIMDTKKQVWVDDQFMNIYFHKNNNKIVASPINDFDEIFYTLGDTGMEQLGKGGDLCLDSLTNNRLQEIFDLECEYDVKFLLKNNPKSKGECIDYTRNPKGRNMFITIPDKLTDKVKKNIQEWSNYANAFKYNFSLLKIKKEVLSLPNCPAHIKEFIADKEGLLLCHKHGGIYVNRNFTCNTMLDLEDYLDQEQFTYFNHNKVCVAGSKKNIQHNMLFI